MKRDVIILAGAKNKGALKQVSEVPYEALIPLLDRPIIEYVLDALLQTPSVGRIIVVGPKEPLSPLIGDRVTGILDCSDSILENVIRGVEALQGEEKILLTSSDIPLITPEAIEDFLSSTYQVAGDLYYPIIRREDNESLLPDVERTYVRLKEGTFTGGNLFFFNPQVIPICSEPIKKFIEKRKNPIQMTRLLGMSFLVKLVLGQLSLEAIRLRMNKVLGISTVPIVSHHPVMGFDVDKPSDLRVVERFLQKKDLG